MHPGILTAAWARLFRRIQGINYVDYRVDDTEKQDLDLLEDIDLDAERLCEAVFYAEGWRDCCGEFQALEGIFSAEILTKIRILCAETAFPGKNKRHFKRSWPSLGAIGGVSLMTTPQGEIALVVRHHKYMWRYKHDHYYLESLIDLGHARGHFRMNGFIFGPPVQTAFITFCVLKKIISQPQEDWRILC